MRAGTFHIRYNVDMILRDNTTGKVKKHIKMKNLIVNKGLEIMAKLLNGVTTTSFSYIAIGTDNTTATASDTSLGSELTRSSATCSYEANYKARFYKEFTFTSSSVVREVGIFDASSGGNMLNRIVSSSTLPVGSETNLEATILMTMATS